MTLGRLVVAAALLLGLSGGVEAGLFLDAAALDRLRAPLPAAVAADRDALLARAREARLRTADPFVADDMTRIRFGKGEPADGIDDTLTEAVDKLRADSDAMRDLALAFALTGDDAFAERAVAMMTDWARRGDVINFYDFEPDFVAASHRSATQGFRSDRPWNFGLETVWQCYGLINAADAVLLLLRGAGHRIAPSDASDVEAWLRRLSAAVNAGLHAWTRWADANPGSGPAFARYRSDNHLSWALVGLLAGAAALQDDALADYALRGGAWSDGRSEPYANPSSIRSVIDAAIEGGAAAGRIFEERIGRDPPVGYALFHLQAMSLAARIAAVHFRDPSVWTHRGGDGAGMLDAFRRYAGLLRGELMSPDPREAARGVRGDWLFALSPPGYGGADRAALLAAAPAPVRLTHALGPARLIAAGLAQ